MKMMKKIGIIICVLALFNSCKKPYDYDKEVAAPISTPEKIAASIEGTWYMNSASEVDEKSLVKESIDISDFLTSETGLVPNITFKTSENTFTIDTTGVVKNFFKVNNGKWRFDDDRYPSKITLLDLSNNVITDINISKNLLSTTPQLSFIDGVNCGTEKAISYNISFVKK